MKKINFVMISGPNQEVKVLGISQLVTLINSVQVFHTKKKSLWQKCKTKTKIKYQFGVFPTNLIQSKIKPS